MTHHNKKALLTGNCPNCGGKLEFEENEKSVYCYFCDSSIAVSVLLASTGVKSTSETDDTLAMLASIESPESGLVYLDNFVDTYDWESYAQTSQILLYNLEKMVEKTKIKNSSSPLTWFLDFESVRITLTKRIELLKETAKKMAEKYSNIDNTEMMSMFDTYKKTIASLISSKESLVKRLQSALKFCEKLELEPAKITKAKKDLEVLTKLLDALTPIKAPVDVEEIRVAKESIDKEKVKEFSQKGIDVVSIYNDAVAKMDSGEYNRKELAELFFSIIGYSDSYDRLNEVNKYFSLQTDDNNLFIIGGKKYAFKWVKNDQLAQIAVPANKSGCSKGSAPVENKEKIKAAEYFKIYEVTENCVIAKEPIIQGVTQMITVWGNNIYYIKDNRKVCSYNVLNKEEVVLDRSKKPYPTKRFFFNSKSQEIYFFKRLEVKQFEENTGCSFFAKKESDAERLARETENKNNYSIVSLDLKTTSFKTIVDQVVDVFDYSEEKILYTIAERKEREVTESDGKKFVTKTKSYFVTKLMLINTITGEKEQILSDNCDVQKIANDKVIYTIHTPNDFNKDLHVYTISTKEDVLIEKNILDFQILLNNKLFYQVGNDHYCPLFSNNLEGTDRVEILPNLRYKSILGTRGNWIYIKNGDGLNAVLTKISADGKTTVRLCSQFNKLIEFTDSNVYYLDHYKCLHIVRTDGKEDKVIATGISENNNDTENIIINDDKIYYLRKEPVGIGFDYIYNENDFSTQEREKLVYSNSLYCMDLDGHNVRKIEFDVEKIKNFDEDKLYFVKRENARFEIKIPVAKDQYRTSQTSALLTHFVEYSKVEDKTDIVLTFGLPENREFEIKKGCSGKEMVKTTYTKLPPKSTYKRKGLTKMGDNSAKQENDAPQTKLQQLAGRMLNLKQNRVKTKTVKPSKPVDPRTIGFVGGLILAIAIIGGAFAICNATNSIVCFLLAFVGLAISGVLLFLFKQFDSFNPAVPIIKKFVAVAMAVVFVLGTVFGFISCDGCSSGSNTSFKNAKSLSLTDERDGENVTIAGIHELCIFEISIEETGYYSFYSFIASDDIEAKLLNKDTIDGYLDDDYYEEYFDQAKESGSLGLLINNVNEYTFDNYICDFLATSSKAYDSGDPNFSFTVRLYEGDEYYLVLSNAGGSLSSAEICFIEGRI